MEAGQIEVIPLEPGAAAFAALAPALDDEALFAGNMAWALDGCQLFGVVDGGSQVGAFALRYQGWPGGSEAVVVAGAGRWRGGSLLATVLPHIEATAGADFVRIHTGRPGLIKKLIQQGYEVSEVVLRKRVNHG